MYYLVFVKATRVLRNISLLNFSMRKRPLQCLSDLLIISLSVRFACSSTSTQNTLNFKFSMFDLRCLRQTRRERLEQWLRHRIHRKSWSLVFWYSNCQRKTKCKVRLIKQVTSFVEGASIAHRKVRGYIFQERVGCEQKPNNTYRHMATM